MKRFKPIKGFDALAFKEKAQRRIYKETKGMTHQELIDYYDRKVRNGPFAFLYKQKKKVPSTAREKKTTYKTKNNG